MLVTKILIQAAQLLITKEALVEDQCSTHTSWEDQVWENAFHDIPKKCLLFTQSKAHTYGYKFQDVLRPVPD